MIILKYKLITITCIHYQINFYIKYSLNEVVGMRKANISNIINRN